MTIDFKTAVPAAQAGEKAAQDALMTGFYAWSVTHAKQYVRDSEMAKDVAVEFWAWMFAGGIKDYDPEKGAFFPWMANKLRYRALDEGRKGRPQVMYYSEVNDPRTGDMDPTAGSVAIDLAKAQADLETVAAQLTTAQQKEVFWRLIEGATPAEIADEIGVSVKRAQNLIGEVRAVITEQLED